MCKWSAISKEPFLALPSDAARTLLAQVAVAEATGVRLSHLCAGNRGGRRTSSARQIAMYLCRVVFRMRLCEIAENFGRDRTTAAYAIARIEEARENPRFDLALTHLELALLCLARKAASEEVVP